MPITPLDIKTTLLTNHDATRIREGQKNQEMGLGQQQLVQNQEANQEKVETIQNTQATEAKVIRKEDEGSEKEKEQPDTEPKKKEEKPEEDEPVKPSPPADGVRGLKIDLKA